MIRSFKGSGASVSEKDTFTHAQEPKPENRPIPDDVKRQAMDAVSHKETAAQSKLMKESGSVAAPNTHSRNTQQIGEKIAKMEPSEQNLDSVHKTVTQDGFGGEYG